MIIIAIIVIGCVIFIGIEYFRKVNCRMYAEVMSSMYLHDREELYPEP